MRSRSRRLRSGRTVADIYPRQQLTTRDFGAGIGCRATKLSGYERAISVPLDCAHGMIGAIHRRSRRRPGRVQRARDAGSGQRGRCCAS